MSLIITSEQNSLIRDHAEREYPGECCGVLIGDTIGSANYISFAIPLANEHEDGPARRFRIRPSDLLNAEKLARSQKLNIVGFYHSHPDAPPTPSTYDKEHGWETYSYLIVEMREGLARTARSWKLDRAADRFEEENVLISDCVLKASAKSQRTEL